MRPNADVPNAALCLVHEPHRGARILSHIVAGDARLLLSWPVLAGFDAGRRHRWLVRA